ncbi:ankyrin [Advenella kashmirensis W13003]|uniref:Ankyrin n=1 Tax=Advenella kashmirensis W13003 TaxID=1424334 RepID=V8QPS5_9BURK|nr:ankyrin repeat domain-containing protein [Advenella kashmirensis]ETF01961.1 ankyrin [Advenella kashmirensis W13003]
MYNIRSSSVLKKSILAASLAVVVSACAANSGSNSNWWNDVKNDRPSDVTQAISQGADPNMVNQNGEPALIQAIRDQSMGVFDALAANPKTDVNAVNRTGETPLMYLAIIGDVPRAEKLVARGAKVNRLGWTPLHYAASKGHVDMIKFLLGKGAYPNAPAPDGSSPVLMAVTSKNADAVRALVAAGADPRAINQKNVSALDMAKKMGNSDVLQALNQK